MNTFIRKPTSCSLVCFQRRNIPFNLSYFLSRRNILFSLFKCDLLFCPPQFESDLSERIAVTIRACVLPPSSVCTSYHPPGAAEGGRARCCSYCWTNDRPARQERQIQCFNAKMNLLIREMTFGIWILSVIERRIRK